MLGFLGISLLCNLIEKCLPALAERSRRSSLIYGMASILLVIQIVDSVPQVSTATYAQISSNWKGLQAFTKSLQQRYGANAKIFQVPIIPFPENPPVGQMTDYEHLKPYLVQPQMFFSYGGIRGRSIPWEDRLSPDPKRQIEEIAIVGFDALWIDRFGWSDQSPYEAVLKGEFGLSPLVDRFKRYAVYDLRALKTTLPISEKERILVPVVVRFGAGFGPKETDGITSWRWAGKAGSLVLTNLSKTTVEIRLSIAIELRQSGRLVLPNNCKTNDSPQSLQQLVVCELRIPPSGMTLKIATTSPVYVDGDPRDLRFRVTNFEAE